MKTAGHQEEPAIVGSLPIMGLHLAVIVNRSLRRQRGIGPAVPEDQLAVPGLERVQVRVGRVEKGGGQAGVSLEVGKVVR